jgi:hypothetical protein
MPYLQRCGGWLAPANFLRIAPERRQPSQLHTLEFL